MNHAYTISHRNSVSVLSGQQGSGSLPAIEQHIPSTLKANHQFITEEEYSFVHLHVELKGVALAKDGLFVIPCASAAAHFVAACFKPHPPTVMMVHSNKES